MPALNRMKTWTVMQEKVFRRILFISFRRRCCFICLSSSFEMHPWVKMQICCFKVDRGGKMYSRDGTENTRRCWRKDRWTPSCLQFNNTIFDQKRKYVVNYVEWSSWIQFHRCNTTKTPDQMICWIGMLPFTATVIEKFPNCIKIAKLSQKCAKH